VTAAVGVVALAAAVAAVAAPPAPPTTAAGPVRLLAKAGWGGSEPSFTPSQVADVIHARDLWRTGYRGQGVDVAVVDSGTVPVQGLAGRVVDGPDLSFERGDAGLRGRDTFGHGTHMAGIVAGAADATDGIGAPLLGTWSGIAPAARVVSVKVASADGAADVSQVIAAINWVVQHRRANGLNIRVLNLSFGTNSTQRYEVDPLARAVELAWRSGIVVVAAAGNDGATATRLDNPAADPFVLAVGAEDPGIDPVVRRDAVAEFSSRGNAARHADLLAPGTSILGLRDPGSAIDLAYPTAAVGDRFFKGSGTSQAAAVASGAVALLLSKRPALTPDQVKRLLVTTAAPIEGADPVSQGAGVLDLRRASAVTAPASTAQPFTASTGLGSLEAARGGAHVRLGGSDLTGERTAFGAAWSASAWASAASAGATWTGGAAPSGGSWSTWAWLGSSLADPATGGTATTSTGWTGRFWSGRYWSGGIWSSLTWLGRYWSGALW
jgi:serine protease AprX